jgi:hypothetical protein
VDAARSCCIPQNPRGSGEEASYEPGQPNIRIPRKVLKGGSHLCAAHQLQERRLVLARDGWRLHYQQRHPEGRREPDRVEKPGRQNHYLR